ncbi:hypothetical protein GPALN_013067 [Globodera pallida]|nr:hypothetical protein GPALN_013067 [Globodera pallida]
MKKEDEIKKQKIKPEEKPEEKLLALRRKREEELKRKSEEKIAAEKVRLEKLEELKKQQTESQKQKLKDQSEKKKKELEEKKAMEVMEKANQDELARKRRDELKKLKESEIEKNSLKVGEKKEGKEDKKEAASSLDDERKKKREAVLELRRQEAEKAQKEEEATKAKIDEMQRKRQENALRTEEEKKRRNEEEAEQRKQGIAEKKLAEQRAREEADEALKRAREELENVDDTHMEKFKLDEERPPKMSKEEKKLEDESIKPMEKGKNFVSTTKELEEDKEEAATPKGYLMKKKMQEEREKAKKLAEGKKLKEEEEAKRKADEMSRRRVDALAKKNAVEEETVKKSEEIPLEKGAVSKNEDEERKRNDREELLKRRREEEEKATGETDERKRVMEELAKKREAVKKKKEEEQRKQRDDSIEAERRKLEDQKAKELSARRDAEEALKKAMDESNEVDTTVTKYVLQEEKEVEKKGICGENISGLNEREERKMALELMKREREALKDKKAFPEPNKKESETKKREIEEIRKRDMEEAERKRKETERRMRETEEWTRKHWRSRKESVSIGMKKRKLEEEKAKAEQEEAKRKMEEMKARALEQKEEEEQRIKEREKAARSKKEGIKDEKNEKEVSVDVLEHVQNEKEEESWRQLGEKAEMGLIGDEEVEVKKMKRKTTKERVSFKPDEFLEEHVEPSIEGPSSLDMAETINVGSIRRREKPEEYESEPRFNINKYDTKELNFEQDEVEDFLNKRKQRLQLEEMQHFDEYLPRATRHRTVRKGFVSLPESEVTAARGDTVTFECELFNESDQLSWRVNGLPLETLKDTRCSILNYAYIRQLKIVNVVPSDSNMRVQITLDDQTIESVLMVEETPAEFAEKLPRKTIAQRGETITLAATLSHDAAKRILWYHNGRALTNLDTEHAIVKEGCLCSLEISKVSYRMGGRYTLQVDRVESSTVLEVHGKPDLDQEVGGRIVLDSCENLSLNIRLKSLPEPEVDLYLNGELLTPELRTSITLLEDALLLTRKELTKEDRGTYRVVLFNEYGEDAVEYQVYVRDVPDSPSGLMVTDVGHDYCFLKWNPPPVMDAIDDVERITGYVIEKKGAHRRVWQRVGQLSPYTNEIFVEELDYDHPYVFRVAAVNRFGVGEFSKWASITTGTPFTAPVMRSSPRVSHVYERSLRLEWDECWDTGGSPLFGYDVFCKTEGGDWRKVNNDSTVFVEYCWLDDFLDASKRGCLFKVEAQNYAGLHSDSNICSEPLQYDEQIDVNLAAPGVEILSGNSVNVQWNTSEATKQKLPEGAHVVIQYRSEGSSVWNEVLEQYKKSPAVIEDELKEGVPYRIRVVLKSADGEEMGKSADSRVVKLSGTNLPILTKTLRDALVPKNNEVRLEVCAIGEPAPAYVWLKNGEEIVPTPENDNVSISNEGYISKLTIHRMCDVDEGVYTCQVTNDYGTIESRAELLLGAIQAHFTKAFAEHIDIVEGKDVTFECEVSHRDANVRWLRNKRTINEATNRVCLENVGTNRRLILYGAMKEDSGTYSCETEGGQDRVQTELAVRPPNARIMFSPQGRTVRDYGERVCLFAELSRTTERASWFRNGVELMSKKCFAYVDGLRANLEIYNFDENDVGDYHVTLDSGERSAPAKLKFEVAPKIQLRRYTDEKLVKIGGEEFSVCATLLGHPQPKLALTLNDKSVAAATVEALNGEVRINIRKLRRTHSGRIWLRASNELGEDSTFFDLCVLDVPVPPTKVRVELISSSCVDLYWELGDDGELEEENAVESFIVERKTAERIRWRQIQRKTADRIRTDRGGFFTRIIGLYPNECYAFRILAVNEIGESGPSEPVEAVMPDEEGEEAGNSSLAASNSDPPIPPLSRPNKPDLVVDASQMKCTLSWEKVDRAMIYGIHRRKLSVTAASEKEFWLEISNSERNNFVDRSVLETGRYVYKIIAKLPGVLVSEASEQSDEVFVMANMRQEPPHKAEQTAEASSKGQGRESLALSPEGTTKAVGLVERSDSESSSALSGSQRDSGIQDDDDYRTLMESPGAKPTALKKKMIVKKVVKKKVAFKPTEEATEPMESVEEARETSEPAKEERDALKKNGVFRGKKELDIHESDEEEDKMVEKEKKKKREQEEESKRKREDEKKKREEEEKKREEEEKKKRKKKRKRGRRKKREAEEKKRETEEKKRGEEKKKREEEEKKREEEKKKREEDEKKREKNEKKIIEEEKKREAEEKKREEEKKKSEEEEKKRRRRKEEKGRGEEREISEEKEKAPLTMADGFAKLLEDKEAVEGQLRVELGATLDKNSKEALIRAKWYKDGKLLNTRTSLKYKALLEMPRGEAKLIVSKLEKADSGRYKLELELTKTSAKPSTEANLFVFGKNEPRQSIDMKADKAEQEESGTSKMDEKKLKTTEKRKAPEFVKKPKQSIETINGSRVCLAGSYLGNPMPTFNWLKNGKAFVPSEGDDLTLFNNKFNDDLGVTEFMLEILRFSSPEHSGTYTAVVQNEEGSDSVSTMVSELPLEMLGRKKRGDETKVKRRVKKDDGEKEQILETSSSGEVATLKKAVKAAEEGAEDGRKSPSPTPSIDEENQNIHTKIQRRRPNGGGGGSGKTPKGQASEERDKQRRQLYFRQKQRSSVSSSITEDYIVGLGDEKEREESIRADEDEQQQRTNGDSEKTAEEGEARQKKQSTLQAVRAAIQQRNSRLCRPRFFIRPKPKKQIEEGKSLRLKTAISANPTSEVAWDKNGIVLETGNKYSLFHDGDFFYLEVHSLTPYDNGFYNCTAKNSEGIAICTAQVEVLPSAKNGNGEDTESLGRKRSRREQTAPKILEVLPARTRCIVGESLTVECSLSGSPTPAIAWSQNGTPLVSHPERCVLSFDGECATLSFFKISSTDAGTYSCSAENAAGTAKTDMLLEVQKPPIRDDDGLAPKFLESKKRLRRELGECAGGVRETVVVAEVIEGTEPISFQWFSPNRIEMGGESKAYTIERFEKDSRLVILDAFPTDSGEYKCVAENKYGSAKCSIELRITERRKSPSEGEVQPVVRSLKTNVEVERGRKCAELSFEVTGSDPVVCWYRVMDGGNEERIIPNVNNKKYETSVSENGKLLSLRIFDVQKADEGQFKLVAINRSGEASAIANLQVK